MAGIILVVKGGDAFVDAASWMAKAAGIPPFIVGATIVSVATTLPEMIVSCLAAGEGKIEMAIGNAVGSVTANTALIMAIAFLFMSVTVVRRQYIVQCSILIACASVLVLGTRTGVLAGWASVVLVALFAGFVVLNLFCAARQQTEDASESVAKDKGTLAKNLASFVLGAVAIVGGSQLLVQGGSDLALLLGVPERIVAVTLVAVGTSLPELVTTLTAIRKKESALSVGNIIGANIIDLSLILPLCALVSGSSLPVSAVSRTVDLPVCLAATLLAVLPLLLKERSGKAQGAMMLAGYVGYLAITL